MRRRSTLIALLIVTAAMAAIDRGSAGETLEMQLYRRSSRLDRALARVEPARAPLRPGQQSTVYRAMTDARVAKD